MKRRFLLFFLLFVGAICNQSFGDFIFTENVLPIIQTEKFEYMGYLAYEDARNDGVKRFYVTGAKWRPDYYAYEVKLLEIEVSTAGYVQREIGSCNYGDFIFEYHYFLIAKLHNDNKNRIYIWFRDSGLIEYEWDGNQWKKTVIIPTGFSAPLKTAATKTSDTIFAFLPKNFQTGKLKEDGVERLYFENMEYTFTGSSFTLTDVLPPFGDNYGTHYNFIISDGRNDGKERIYCLGMNQFSEIWWENGSWQKMTTEVFLKDYTNFVIGPGRNDGKNRIYFKCLFDEYLGEISWENNQWITRKYKVGNIQDISLGGGFYRTLSTNVDILTITTISDARNDGVQRLYFVDGSASADAVVELTWNGSGWDLKEYPLKDRTFLSGPVFAVLSTLTPLNAVIRQSISPASIRKVNGVDYVEMNKAYTSSGDEYVFAYPQQAYNSEKSVRDKLQPVNNYFQRGMGWTSVWYYVDEPGNVSLKIYNVSGELVKILVDGWRDKGQYCEVWTGRNEAGNICGSGIYLVNLVTKNNNITKKICMVK
jgi:hypothetical protein